MCHLGRTYYGKQFDNDGQRDSVYDTDNNCTPAYKEGIREDRISNHRLASRGSKAKPKRTYTTKTSLKDVCRFQIVLQLEPGVHWFIAKTSVEKGTHNHLELTKQETSRKRNSLSLEVREKIRVLQTYCHSGSTQGVMKHELDGFQLSQQQIFYSSEQSESSDSSCEPGTSSANRLMNYLKKQSEEKKMRYIALFHEVDESSLVSFRKYDVAKVLKAKAAEEEAAKARVSEEAKGGWHCVQHSNTRTETARRRHETINSQTKNTISKRCHSRGRHLLRGSKQEAVKEEIQSEPTHS